MRNVDIADLADDLADSAADTMRGMAAMVVDSLHGKPSSIEEIFKSPDGEHRGYAVFVVPSGDLSEAILNLITARFGDPPTHLLQEFPDGRK